MIDFRARFDDLLVFLCAEYDLASTDRDALAALCAMLVRVPGVAAPSVILETDWLSRYCTTAWFALGMYEPHALGALQCQRTREAAFTLDEWEQNAQAAGAALLFVEPEYRKPRVWTAVKSGSQFRIAHRLRECVRLRVPSPKSVGVVTTGQGADARVANLASLTKQLLVSEFRAGTAPRTDALAGLAFFCELAQSLAREGTDWSWIANMAVNTAVRHAHLFGRERTEREDWRIAGGVLACQVPVWTTGLLRGMLARKQEDIEPRMLSSAKWAEYVGAETAQAGRQTLKAEVSKLARLGIFERAASGRGWRVLRGFGGHIRKLLDGNAFI